MIPMRIYYIDFSRREKSKISDFLSLIGFEPVDGLFSSFYNLLWAFRPTIQDLNDTYANLFHRLFESRKVQNIGFSKFNRFCTYGWFILIFLYHIKGL